MSTRTDPLLIVFTFVLAMCLGTSTAHASWGHAGPSGDPPSDPAEPADGAAEPEAPTVEGALESGDLGIALEQARMQREANPTPENWRREAQVLEEMGQYESAARAYEGELAALPEGDEAAARRKEARADLERVQQAARGTADGDPPSQHREQLDERWEPKPAPKQAVPRPEPRPAPPSDERIVRKWYFWVTIAAIAASAAAVTGIAVKASRDRRRDALDLTRDPGTMPPPLFRF